MAGDDPFRSDHDAALARADALEHENEELRAELREARKPKAKPAPRPTRAARKQLWGWDLPSRAQIAGGAVIGLITLFVVYYPECRAHDLLYTTPGDPSGGFVVGDKVVVVDDVESHLGHYEDSSTDDAGTRVTVLAADTGKQLAVHLFPNHTRCQPLGASIWCKQAGHLGSRYDVPSFARGDAPEPPAPQDDRTCETAASGQEDCEHAETVGKLLVITSLTPAKRAHAIDPRTGHTVWTFGRTK